MDIDPGGFPYLKFKTLQAARIDPTVGRGKPEPRKILSPRNETDSPPKTTLRPPKTRPIMEMN